MNYEIRKADMRGAVTAFRCFADFLAARPALPELVVVELKWSYTEERWTISGHLYRDDGTGIEAWALALDDPMTIVDRVPGDDGDVIRRELTGTVHGIDVAIWSRTPAGGDAG